MNDRILKFADSRQFIGRIARSGENNTRSLAFDCSSALAEYPTSQIIAVIQRPQGDPYTVTPDADGTIRRITLTAYDLEFNGHLQIELRVLDGDKILKSAIYTATVDDSIRGEADAPGQPVRDVLDRLDAEIKQAQAVVDDIRQKLENGEFNGSDAEVTAENIQAALGYTPADKVVVDQLTQEKVDKALFDEVFEIHEASPNLYVPQSEGWTDNAMITSGGYPTVNDSAYKSYCVTPLIPIESGTYTITPSPVTVATADKNAARFYSAEGTVLSEGTLQKSEEAITFAVPFGASYVRFSVLKNRFRGNNANIDTVVQNFNNRVMIVKGETIPSEYVPYYPAGNEMKNIAIPDKSVTLKTIGDDAAPIISPLMGKKIANFGDSIFGNARPPLDVSTFLASDTGATVYNCAFGGCRMAEHVGHWDAFSMYRLAYAIANNDYAVQDDAIGYDDRTSYAEEPLAVMKTVDYSKLDILTIGYGTNDFTGNNPIDNADNPMDTSTVCGALRYSIEALLGAYPNLRIFVLLPTYRFWMDSANQYTDDALDHVNDLGKTLLDYNTAIA